MAVAKSYRAQVDSFIAEDQAGANFGSRAFLRVAGTASARKRSLILFPTPVQPGDTVVSATLTVYLKGTGWAGGPHTITVERISQTWAEGKVTWNNAPNVAGTPVTAAVTGGTDGQAVQVTVTGLVADIASNLKYFGFRLIVDTTGDKDIYSSEASDPARRPLLSVTRAIPPDAPVGLRPSGNQAVASTKPLLGWEWRDQDASASQAESQVQISANSDLSAPEFDSGSVPNTSQAFDPAANLLTKNQSDIETNTTGFVADTNVTLARSTTASHFRDGVAGLDLTSVAAGDMIAGTLAGTSGIPVIAGTTYTASVYERAVASTRTVRVDIRWYDAAGATLSTTAGTGSGDSTSAWTRYSTTAVAPTNAAFAQVRLVVVATGAASEVHSSDDWMFEAASTASTWRQGYDALADNVTRYWRVRVKDGNGAQSAWSNIATFVRRSQGTLAITAPASDGASVEETSVQFTWTFTGRTQQSVEIVLERKRTGETNYTEIYRRGRTAQGTTSFQLPAGVLTDQVSTTTYRVTVRVWDDQGHTSLPGDPDYVQAQRTFIFSPSAGVAATTGLTATATTDSPKVTLAWTDGSNPTNYALAIDGVFVNDRIDPTIRTLDVYQASPNVSHTYRLDRVVLTSGVMKHSSASQTASATARPAGIWLVAPDDAIEVCLLGTEQARVQLGETGDTFQLLSRQDPVRVTDVVGGYQGSVAGLLINAYGVSAATWLSRFERLKALPLTSRVRLIFGHRSFPVVLGEAEVSQVPNTEEAYDVSVAFWQTGEFTVAWSS